MSQGTRFVEVPADSLLSTLEAIAEAIRGKGGHAERGRQGREIVFDFTPPANRGTVRVYTSLAVGADTVRDCGKDAVRLVVGIATEKRFRTLTEPRKMLRTAPTNLEHDQRVNVFLDRLKGALREAYRAASNVPLCPKCNSLMALRQGRDSGQQFYGCLNFPGCRGTRPKPE